MATQYFVNDMPLSDGGMDCSCPPMDIPSLDFKPPPDPFLAFPEWEYSELNQLREQCELTVPTVFPVEFVPRTLGQHREYFALILTGVAVLVLLSLVALLVVIWLARRGRCCGFLKNAKSSRSSSQLHNRSNSTLVINAANRQYMDSILPQGTVASTDSKTKWSYNSMRPVAADLRMKCERTNNGERTKNRGSLHPANSLGVLMYGSSTNVGMAERQRFLQHPHSTAITRKVPTQCVTSNTRTLPKSHLHFAQSVPTHLETRGGRQMKQNTIDHSKQQYDCLQVYEEIAHPMDDYSRGDETVFENVDDLSECEPFQIGVRLPPPSNKPPPPPVEAHELDSPVSCSCSGGSTSIDFEAGIQVTPSPARANNTTRETKSVHNSSSSSSPHDTTHSDCCACSNGRESGYGTTGRAVPWASPLQQRRGERLGEWLRRSTDEKSGKVPKKTKELWVSTQNGSPRKGLAMLPSVSQHSMTYV